MIFFLNKEHWRHFPYSTVGIKVLKDPLTMDYLDNLHNFNNEYPNKYEKS
jgi:hypothetical protein